MMSVIARSLIVLFLCVPVAAPAAPKILVFGDSLSAGYGIDVNRGWVALLRARLQQEAYPHEVINASVSGETTSGGLARLPATLDANHPDLVLIELGGNDGLRGLPPKTTRENLVAMAELVRKAGAKPVLFEMRIPPNYGAFYASAFQQAFHDAADKVKAPLVPFFLGSIVDKPAMFQDDQIHPSQSAQPTLLDAVWPTLKPLLR
ncbi:MAG TPA: arylesterase [Nevskiaceae bacterium]|nr:arylesterase [Nevskiaceae bacterium]